jgi:hypothetical protein
VKGLKESLTHPTASKLEENVYGKDAINKINKRKTTSWKMTRFSNKRPKSRMYGRFLRINTEI